LTLFDYARPWSTYFHPLPYPRHIFISASEPSRPSIPPPPSTPQWKTPLGSSTPAWDPSSSTPFGTGMSSIFLLEMNTSLSGASVAPAPTGPQYALLDVRLDSIKVTATINGRRTTVWDTLVGGE